MTEKLVILQLQQLPENLKQEVLDFIGYLLSKHQAITTHRKPKPAFGCGTIQIEIAPDFDEPIEDFKAYME